MSVYRIGIDTYSNFLRANPPHIPYLLPQVLEAYSKAFDSAYELLGIARGETLIAVGSFFVGRKFSSRYIKLMPMRLYDGLSFRKLDNSKSQKREYERLQSYQLLSNYLTKQYGFYQVNLPPSDLDIRPFQWSGAKVLPQYTYVMELPEFSEKKYTKSLLEVLHYAIKANLQPSTCEIDELISLQIKSYKRHNRRPPVDSSIMTSLLNLLHNDSLLKIYSVRNSSGDLLAALATLELKDASYFFVSGTEVENDRGSSHLLYHHVFKTAAIEGKNYVDLCGANTPSINIFKSSFGPSLKVFFRIQRANSWLAKIGSFIIRV
ncbi:MAG: GNAT family N-acetyltransferase [Candidatus Kryptoniota bacterium]